MHLAERTAGPAGGVTYTVIGYVGCQPRSLRAELVGQAFTTGYWFAHGLRKEARRRHLYADPVFLKVECSAGGQNNVKFNRCYKNLS